MSTFIILIDRNTPEHWEYAKNNGFWDLQKDWRGLADGDTAYFWVTGTPGRVVGRAHLTSGKRPLPSNTTHAWSPGDARRGDYHYRIDLADFEDLPKVPLQWGEVRAATGAPGRLNPVTRIPDQGVSWLLRRLGLDQVVPRPKSTPAETLAGAWWEDSDATESETELERDMRTRIEASIVIRQGQGRFRRHVLMAYGAACCITGTTLEPVLDAAHISPYKGDHTDRPDNALLLRTDVHTLFDRHLVTVTPGGVVRVAPQLISTEYGAFEGQAVQPPRHGPSPSPDSLAEHNRQCTWFTD